MISKSRRTGDILECGEKPNATPLFFCEKVSSREKRRRAALAAAVQKVRQRCPKPAGSFVVLLKKNNISANKQKHEYANR
jgi:hypothetical protein